MADEQSESSGSEMDALDRVMAEIELEGVFNVEEGPVEERKKRSKADLDDLSFDPFDRKSDLVVKQPLSETISRSGNVVFCGDRKVGTVSYLMFWNPPAIAANCLVHGDGICYFTAPFESADEDQLVRWLGEARCYANASDHMRCVPSGAYFRRVRKKD